MDLFKRQAFNPKIQWWYGVAVIQQTNCKS